jgi:hypothetical protein
VVDKLMAIKRARIRAKITTASMSQSAAVEGAMTALLGLVRLADPSPRGHSVRHGA